MAALQPIPTHPLFQDLTGKTFGRLTVLGFLGRPKPRSNFRWLCRCSCGTEKGIQGCALTAGAVVSCGCYARRKRAESPFPERNKAYQRRYREKNKEVRKEKLREWRSRCPEKRYSYNREYAYRRKYGMSLADALALLQSQGGKCKICKEEIVLGGTGGPVVDHNHVTGQVRGILCRTCNVGIGCFLDDVALLAEAIEYLKRARAESES